MCVIAGVSFSKMSKSTAFSGGGVLNTFGYFWKLKWLHSLKRPTDVFSSRRLYLTSVTFAVEEINHLGARSCAHCYLQTQ